MILACFEKVKIAEVLRRNLSRDIQDRRILVGFESALCLEVNAENSHPTCRE